MENNSDSVLEMYLYETNTLLEQLDNIMLSAEQADTLSEDDVNEIFRIMHTLKGSAAMMEFEPLMTIAHRIEDLFFLIRENTMDVVPEQDRPQLFDLLFKSIDYFRSEVSKIESGEPLSNNIDNFVNAINMLLTKLTDRRWQRRSRQTSRRKKFRAAAIRITASRSVSIWTMDAAWRICAPLWRSPMSKTSA